MEDDKIIILLDHTIHHNEHHAEDFISLAKDLREKGKEESAKLAESAAEDVKRAVDKLIEAKELYIKNN